MRLELTLYVCVQVSPGFPTDNPAVSTIPLRENIAPDGLVCTVSGWGYLDLEGTMPQTLQVVTLPFISHDTCRHIYRNYTEGSIEPGMNCAGYLHGGKDACDVSFGSLTFSCTEHIHIIVVPFSLLRDS
jgi:hypothetical protein